MKLELTVEQINLVLAALSELPFKVSANLIVEIKQQAEKQQAEKQQAEQEVSK